MAEPLEVEVVSADRVVWSGKSTNVIAMTVDGEIGILPGHSPVLGVLVPGVVVVFTGDNQRERIGVGGGFISVTQGRVSVLSEYAALADEVSLRDAERELAEAQRHLDSGDGTDEDRRQVRRAEAQLRAAQRNQ